MPIGLIKWIPEIVVFIFTTILAIMLHNGAMDRATLKHNKAMQDLTVTLENNCDKKQKKTKESYDALQGKIRSLNARLIDADSVRRSAQCNAVISSDNAAGEHNGAASGSGSAGGNGLTTQFLRGFAGEAEHYRLQLIACQGWITQNCTPE